MSIILGLIFIFISTFVQGMTSFGFSLVSIPLLLLIMDMKSIVILTVTYSLFINFLILRNIYKHSDILNILPLLISAVIFTIIGVNYLENINADYLKTIIAIILLTISIINLFGIKFKLKNPRKFYIPIGITSGILNGISGIGGPPILLFLSNQDMDKMKFRATLTTYFFILNIVSISSFLIKGIYTVDIARDILIFLPALIIGTSLGIYTGNRVNEEVFKKVVTIGIGIMGILMLF